MRHISQIFDSVHSFEGAGFPVRRPFPTTHLNAVDPFLLLDEMGPVDLAPGQAKGAPDHPHRGFETVTYMLAGQMVHKDSTGREGTLNPGDVQWMTAGAGVVHSEMPGAELLAKGGRMHGVQLWVNLPAREKMTPPQYQEIPAADIPEAQTGDGRVHVRVIAGEALGERAVIATHTPIEYFHFTIQPGGEIAQSIPDGHEVFAYILSGSGVFAQEQVLAHSGQMIVFEGEGDVFMAAPHDALESLELLLIGGQPLREPIARYGPFVMNTEAEIYQAVSDYRTGRMGTIR